MAALLGSVGQLNYSAANSYLDAAAAGQQAGGSPVLSVQFGAWKGAGMASASAAKMESIGLGALDAAIGLQALSGLLRASAAHPAGLAELRLPPLVAMAPVDWPVFLQGMPQSPPYFADFTHLRIATSALPAGSAPAQSSAASPVAAMPFEQRLAYVTAEVEAAAVRIIGSAISASEPLMAAGLDSLGAVEMRNSLEARLGLELPSTLVFDYPTIAAIAAFVSDSLAIGTEEQDSGMPDAGLSPAAVLTAIGSSPGAGTLLAVSGMASRSPAGVLLAPVAADVQASVSISRWDAELQLTQDLPARFGGWLDDAFLFDTAAFGITGTGKRGGQLCILPQLSGRAACAEAAPA